MSRCALPTNIFESAKPELRLSSELSPEVTSKPVPKIQHLSHNLLVLNDLELMKAGCSASAGLIGEIELETASELRHFP